MLKRLGLVLAALLLLGAPAFAAPAANVSYDVGVCDPSFAQRCIKPDASGNVPVTAAPAVVTATDKSGTVTAGGTAQTAIAANASRKGWCIQNPPTATEALQVRSGTAATTTTGITVPVGFEVCNPPGLVDQGIISVLGATTSHAWQGTEYQ